MTGVCLAEQLMPKKGGILVVDDEAELMVSLCEALGRQGYEAFGFTSGQVALKVLQEQDFDLILLDLMMPEMDGIEFLKEALKIDPNTVGIIMTGYGTVQTAVEAMKQGAYEYVLKPFKMNTLLPVLLRAKEMRRLKDENLQLRESMVFYDLLMAVSFTRDIDVILDKIADAVLDQCGADEMSIMLPVSTDDELYVAVIRGEQRKGIRGERASIREGIAGWVVANRETLLLQGKIQDLRFTPVRPRADIGSSISMPLLAGGKCVGVLNVNLKKKSSFPPGKMKALNILAGVAASALENARLGKELQQAELEMTRLDRLNLVGEMAAGIAHEIRNPMTVVRGYLQLLQLREEYAADRGCFGVMIEEIDRANSIITEFLALAKKAPVEMKKQSLNETLAALLPLLQAEATGAGMSLNLELGDIPALDLDEKLIRQVVLNLVRNGIEAMPDKGVLTIKTYASGNEVMLAVKDQGDGIGPEALEKIGTPFFSTKEKGTGIGLAVCYKIAERHNARIKIDTGEGGTTFAVCFQTDLSVAVSSATG
jgi:signal transduction histidine kinase